MFSGLCQDVMDSYIKPKAFPISGWTWCSGYDCGVPNQDDPRLYPMGSQFSISVLLNFCQESVGA